MLSASGITCMAVELGLCMLMSKLDRLTVDCLKNGATKVRQKPGVFIVVINTYLLPSLCATGGRL